MTIYQILFAVIFSSIFSGEKPLKRINEEQVPEEIVTHLGRFCASRSNEKYFAFYEKGETLYRVKLKCDNQKFEISYSSSGIPLVAEMNVKVKDIPEGVTVNLMEDLKKNFSYFNIKSAGELSIHTEFKYKFLIKGILSHENSPALYYLYVDSFGTIRRIVPVN